jgi:hypothetical protein
MSPKIPPGRANPLGATPTAHGTAGRVDVGPRQTVVLGSLARLRLMLHANE